MEQSGQVGDAVDDRVRFGLGTWLRKRALAAADQHRGRADRVPTADVGGQVVADDQRGLWPAAERVQGRGEELRRRLAQHPGGLAGGVLEQPDPSAGVEVLAVVAAGDPVDLGGEQLRAGPHGPERGVQVVVGRPVAGVGEQHVAGRLARPGQGPASSWRTPSAATASTRASGADANSRAATATGVTSSPSEVWKPSRARRPASAAGVIESVLVVNRTVSPWSRSHRTASGAPGTTWLPTYRVPSRSSSTVSMPVSRPTTHLRHARLDHPSQG